MSSGSISAAVHQMLSLRYGDGTIFKITAVAIMNFKKSIFGHVTVIGSNICCSVPNFIKMGHILTDIWRFNNFQNCGCPPSWILKICSFHQVAFVGMPFCF